MLDELQEVDGRVEEGGLEFALEVDFGAVFAFFEAVHEVGDVHEGGDVDGELAEDRGDDVPVPDVVLWAFAGELLDGLVFVLAYVMSTVGSVVKTYLRARDAQKAHTH